MPEALVRACDPCALPMPRSHRCNSNGQCSIFGAGKYDTCTRVCYPGAGMICDLFGRSGRRTLSSSSASPRATRETTRANDLGTLTSDPSLLVLPRLGRRSQTHGNETARINGREAGSGWRPNQKGMTAFLLASFPREKEAVCEAQSNQQYQQHSNALF